MNEFILVRIFVLALVLVGVSTGTASATSYVHGNDQLIAKINETGNITYYHSDHLGSTSVITNKDGEVLGEQKNLPFGELIQGGEKYGFTGKELDETGLQYFGARYYSPEPGRFLTLDSFGGQYIYAMNNPLKFVDPDGNLEAYPPIERKHTPKEKEEYKRKLRNEGKKFFLGITGIEAVISLPGLIKGKGATGVRKPVRVLDKDGKAIAKIEKVYEVLPGKELARVKKASWFTKFRWKFLRFGKFLRVGGRVLGGIGQIFVVRNSFMNIHKLDMDYTYGEGNWLDPEAAKMIPKKRWKEIDDYFRKDLNIAVRIKDKELEQRHISYLYWLVQIKLGKDLNAFKRGDPYMTDPYEAHKLLREYYEKKGRVVVPKLYQKKKRRKNAN